LVVTGSEPVAERVEDEPCWDALAGLLDWSVGTVPAVLLSCLAAHAALTRFDGLARVRLAAKCTGLFPQEVAAGSPLGDGIPTSVPIPHSRWNAVDTAAVAAAGWEVVMEGEASGWTVASRRQDGTDLVLVQGHPEYGPTSLLREYHRDVRRYLLGEQDGLPCLPVGCVHPDDAADVEALQAALVAGDRDPALLESFPFDEAADRVSWPWRDAAVRLYRNWVRGARGERSD
jgi:homoserine O-succinyltransferase